MPAMTAITIGCPRRRNGNTPRGPGHRARTRERSETSLGMRTIPKTKHILSGRRSRTRGAFMTWRATFANGSRTFTRGTTTPTVRHPTPQGPQAARDPVAEAREEVPPGVLMDPADSVDPAVGEVVRVGVAEDREDREGPEVGAVQM